MSYLPPEKKNKNAITPARIAIWVFVGGLGIYLVVSGLIGAINNG